MLKCSKCGFDNKDGATFCINCGERFDGVSLCPYCHEEIQKTDKKCPHCNKSLGKESLEPLSEEESSRQNRREKVNPIFNKIFIIAGIVILALSTCMIFINYYTIGDARYGAIELLFKNWNSTLETNSDIVHFVYRILSAIFIAGNWIFTYVMAAIGINKSVKELKKEKEFNYSGAKYAGFILLSNLFMYFIVTSESYSLATNPDFFKVDPSYLSTLSNILVYVALTMIYRTYYSFKKGRMSRLIEKVLFSFFFFGLVLYLSYLVVPGVILFKEDGTGAIKFFGAFNIFPYLSDFVNSPNLADYQASFVLQMISLVFIFVGSMFFVSLGCIFLQLYYGKIEEQKSFKIPFFSASIFTTILIVIGMICHLVSICTSPFVKEYSFVLSLQEIVLIIPLIIMVGVLVPSLILTRRNILIDKLLESEKEK